MRGLKVGVDAARFLEAGGAGLGGVGYDGGLEFFADYVEEDHLFEDCVEVDEGGGFFAKEHVLRFSLAGNVFMIAKVPTKRMT